ncbi:glycosyltransferase [Rhodococcus globerulus]|uniref:glycosyltransferase n=1 Tax=Rhodococcus globerulus TaxID=33008 RepID=UPI000ADBCA81|nr:glycosyltransferase family 2 protein [Rhodococcus globerulus]
MSDIRVSVVIVGYNSGHMIEECLRGLDNTPQLEIVLVDNCSNDDTIAVFERVVPGGVVVARTSNDGFAVAVNDGVRASSGQNVLLLNPDALVSPDQVLRLADLLDSTNGVGIVAPVVASDGAGHATVPAGHFPSIYRMALHASGLSRLGRISKRFEGHYLLTRDLRGGVIAVDWVTGGCMMVSRTAWMDIGGLTERWFMYAEDIEFCWRAEKADIGRLLVLDETIQHAIGGSSKGIDGRLNSAWVVNLFDFYVTSMSRGRVSAECWRLSVILGFLLRAGAYKAQNLTSQRGKERSSWNVRRYLGYSKALMAAPVSMRD